MKLVRFGVLTAAVVALIPLTATGASAAPPANDKPGGAVDITLGQTVMQDTSQATTGSLDAKVNQNCGAPFTNASVWYQYTPTASGPFILDMSASDYSGGFMVFHGTHPNQNTLFNCGPTEVAVRGHAGKTYTIMVFSDTTVNGGNLVLSLSPAPPAPTVAVTVNPKGQAYPTGNARVSGTFTCTNADFAETDGTLTQVWKRLKITGNFRQQGSGLCDGQPHHWSKTVVSDNGLYGDGAATVKATQFACGLLKCSRTTVTQDVTLSAPQLPSLRPGAAAHAAATHAVRTPSCRAAHATTMYARSAAC